MPLVLLAPHSVSHNLLQRNELSSDQTFQLHMNADGSIMGFKRSAQKKKKKKRCHLLVGLQHLDYSLWFLLHHQFPLWPWDTGWYSTWIPSLMKLQHFHLHSQPDTPAWPINSSAITPPAPGLVQMGRQGMLGTKGRNAHLYFWCPRHP